MKALFSILEVAHAIHIPNDPFAFFCANWAQKNIRGFILPTFFKTAELQHKLLILIETPSIFH